MYNRNPQSKQEQISEELASKYMPAGNLGNMSSKFEQGFIVSHGKGSKIYDLSGNEYIDYDPKSNSINSKFKSNSCPLMIEYSHIVRSVEIVKTFKFCLHAQKYTIYVR